MTEVCVVLVNWNGWRDTVECLESLFLIDSLELRVIVCDNGSSDDSVERICAWADGRLEWQLPEDSPLNENTVPIKKPVAYQLLDRLSVESGKAVEPAALTIVTAGENLGFAGGNNLALRYALKASRAQFFWLLNNDTVVVSESLPKMIARMRENSQIGLCGATLLYYHQPEKVQAYGGGYYCKWIGLPWHLGRLKRSSDKIDRQHVERWMNYVVGASMLVSRRFIEQVGLMCEDYFLYFEEVDWAIRAGKRFKLGFSPESIVYHKVGAAIGTSSNPLEKSPTCDYYNIRNRLFFTRKFYPWALPTIYLFLVGALLTRLLMGKWARAKMIWRLFFNFDAVDYSPIEPSTDLSQKGNS